MRRTAFVLVAGAAALVSLPAAAAVVLDPVPAPILTGFAAAVTPFATAAATSSVGQRALVHSLQPARDGSGRLFVNDSRGTITVTSAGGGTTAAWFDIRNQGVGFTETSSQGGLISFALHPNFGIDPAKPGYNVFYTIDTTAPDAGAVTYAGKGPVDHRDVVREWTVADPAAATATITATREVLSVAQPFGDHGPGTIAFNPTAAPGSADYGKLYIGLGDGGAVNDPYNNAQDLGSPLGKILRIDPADPDGAGPATYSIPADNPFAGQTGKLGEVWAYGLRNPQQFRWDEATGALYIADIGQAQLEEVNVGVAGGNYGWPLREGTFGRSTDKGVLTVNDDPNPGGFIDPIAEYDHGEGAAIGGVVVYHGAALPELVGRVLMADLVNGRLFYFTPGDTSGVGGTALVSELALLFGGDPTSMLALEGAYGRVDLRLGTDLAGEVYLLTKQDGDIYRLAAAAVPEPATWLTLGGGLMLLAGVLRRARRSVPAAG